MTNSGTLHHSAPPGAFRPARCTGFVYRSHGSWWVSPRLRPGEQALPTPPEPSSEFSVPVTWPGVLPPPRGAGQWLTVTGRYRRQPSAFAVETASTTLRFEDFWEPPPTSAVDYRLRV